MNSPWNTLFILQKKSLINNLISLWIFCFWPLKIRILFLMEHFTSKSMVWPWVLLSTTLANAFLVYHEKNWLEPYPLEYKPFYYRMSDDYVFVLFNSLEHLKCFESYCNSCHFNISFTIENEKDNKCSFLTQGKVNKANVLPLSTTNQLLAEFVLISTVSYHLTAILAWFIYRM